MTSCHPATSQFVILSVICVFLALTQEIVGSITPFTKKLLLNSVKVIWGKLHSIKKKWLRSDLTKDQFFPQNSRQSNTKLNQECQCHTGTSVHKTSTFSHRKLELLSVHWIVGQWHRSHCNVNLIRRIYHIFSPRGYIALLFHPKEVWILRYVCMCHLDGTHCVSVSKSV